MQDEFHRDVEKTFRAAAKHRDIVKVIKKQASENPDALAKRAVEVVPDSLKKDRLEVLEKWGVDLADAAAVRSFKADSIAQWQILQWLATRHQLYTAFLRLVGRYFVDPELTDVRSAQAVCEAFLIAVECHLYTIVLDFDELRKKFPEEGFPTEELTKVLSGIVATRTSLHSNPPLRAAIDELREHVRDKPAKRERFEQLLKELPSQVLEVWEETEHPLGNLSEVRTEVARRLGKKRSRRSSPVEVELAKFADHEKLLQKVREAGLTPREYELFKLRVVENPGMTLRQAAERMGIAEGTAKSSWSRIKRTLGAS